MSRLRIRKKAFSLDTYKSHYKDKVNDSFNNSDIKTLLIPLKTTHYLQSLNVLINSSLKAK
jgi:hypothetical protein